MILDGAYGSFQFLHFLPEIDVAFVVVLVLMGLTFVASVFVILALPVKAMRPGLHLFGKVMHSHSTQMFNGRHHMAHTLINGAMAALVVPAMLGHGPF